jgi:type III pantothenate kinase
MLSDPDDGLLDTDAGRVSVLAIDIGNSRVHFGAMRQTRAATTSVLATTELDGLSETVARMWEALDEAATRAIVAGSVAPEILRKVRAAVGDVTGEELLVIREQIDLPIPVAVDNPAAVGVDRVCAAAAAHAQLQQACVVADFGTAITIDLVGDDGVFMGGAILPGLRLSALALEEHTAALPPVQIVEPTHPWGRNTMEAMNNGIFFGAIGALREIVERYATETGRWMPLVATGGGAELIAKHANFVDHVVPDLTLRGIALAYHRSRGQHDA